MNIRSGLFFSFIFLLASYGCKKPCQEEPIGADPLANYYVQWRVETADHFDAIGTVWSPDSIFTFSEDLEVISISYDNVNVAQGVFRSSPLYFYNFPEDESSYSEEAIKFYYLDYVKDGLTDRDTLEIRFKAIEVECGQLLDPLTFYYNGEQLTPLRTYISTLIQLTK